MPYDVNSLQARYIRAETERIRLKYLTSALRKQVETAIKPNSMELSPLSGGFLPSDERPPNDSNEAGILWKNYTSGNAGLNKRYRIYIGYLYERMGWEVDYSCGKNLISRKNDKLIVTLTETATTVNLENMYSLLGLAMEYRKDNISGTVSALCITSSTLISRVKSLAQKFNIAVREHFYLRNFPCVRCKADIDGQGVYYVPDDEEYLSVRIEPDKGDKYCWSIDEAKSMNFTRPY